MKEYAGLSRKEYKEKYFPALTKAFGVGNEPCYEEFRKIHKEIFKSGKRSTNDFIKVRIPKYKGE